MGKIGKRWGKKKKYSRNWKVENERLVLRGVYILDFEWVQGWGKELIEMNEGKVGAPYQFPTSLIRLQAFWAQMYDYRTIEGVTRAVVKLAKLPGYDNYTTIWRRVTDFEEPLPEPEGKIISASTDGSGVKMNMSGEYFEAKYGDGKKKFIKVTITADPFKKDLLKVEVSLEGEGLSEPEVAEKHLKELHDEGYTIKKFFGDGAFDTHSLFDLCDQYRIEPVMKISKDAVAEVKNGSFLRSLEVEKYHEERYKKWAEKRHYGQRWPGTEGIFSAVKRMFSERVRSRKIENMCKEAKRKFWCYQILRNYGKKKVGI